MKYLKIFECCFTVKGRNYTTILDPQRETFFRLPNHFYTELELIKNNPIDEAIRLTKDKETFDETVTFLMENELAFYTDTPDNFPPISTDFEEPFLVSNAILDYDGRSEYDLLQAIEDMEELGCPFVQIRFYDAIDEDLLIKILNKTNDQDQLLAIEILAKYNPEINLEHLNAIKKDYLKLQSIVFYSAPENKLLGREVINNFSMMMIILSTDTIRDERDCGKVSSDYFVTNSQSFILESINHNNCLNKKISIDKLGYIRNCPSMRTDFGQYGVAVLKDVIMQEEFQKVWHISKKEVSVCKECELRLICSDCRAYTHDNDLYGKPEKCTYDPIAV